MAETLKPLGDGIATPGADHTTPGRLRVAYAPSAHGDSIFQVLGFAHIDEEYNLATSNLANGGLAISEEGNIWWGSQGGVLQIASKEDIKSLHESALQDWQGAGLNEMVNTKTGLRLFARTRPHGYTVIHEVWTPIKPEDTQILIDALFCLHFNKPAGDGQGGELSPQQILEEANRVALHFTMSATGEIDLPKLPVR